MTESTPVWQACMHLHLNMIRKDANGVFAFMGSYLCVVKGIAFCERPFALHRQQSDKDNKMSTLPSLEKFEVAHVSQSFK